MALFTDPATHEQWLWEISDGGIVRLRNPETGSIAEWEPANGNLQITELTSVELNTRNGRILGGAEDKGTALQAGADGLAWKDVGVIGGAGVQIDASTNPAAYYFSTEELERITKWIDNGQDNEFFAEGQVDAGEFFSPALKVIGKSGKTLRERDPFDSQELKITPFLINPFNGKRMLIGATGLYESLDGGKTVRELLPPKLSGFTALAYGHAQGEGLIYAIAENRVYVRPPKAAAIEFRGTVKGVADFVDIAVDPDNWETAYAVVNDGRPMEPGRIFRTGRTAAPNGPTLPGSWAASRISRTIELVRVGGEKVLLVGGRGGVYRALEPFGSTVGTRTTWTEFGA